LSAYKPLLRSLLEDTLKRLSPGVLIARQSHYEDGVLSVGSKRYRLDAYTRLYLLGSGKAVIPMAEAIHALLGDRIEQTLLVGPYDWEPGLPKTDYLRSTHPLPSKQSLEAAKALRGQLESMGPNDLYLYLLSGGNSSLVEWPVEGVTLDQMQATTQAMLHGDMPIAQINTVRKHLSQVKGGRLSEGVAAQGVVLVLSDVTGDDLEAIGSGPLYYDQTTYRDALDALDAHGVRSAIPRPVIDWLKKGKEGRVPETPKQPAPQITHHLAGSNRLVLEMIQSSLSDQGICTTVIDPPIEGSCVSIAERIMGYARSKVSRPHAYLFGGETTLRVRGSGRGGRNQHLCLTLLSRLDPTDNLTILCAATDGIDGHSHAAGAVIDRQSIKIAQADPETLRRALETFDSTGYFEQTGDLIVTGPTHNNLLDIVIVLVQPQTPKGASHV
jgi:glycerate 2-kinase